MKEIMEEMVVRDLEDFISRMNTLKPVHFYSLEDRVFLSDGQVVCVAFSLAWTEDKQNPDVKFLYAMAFMPPQEMNAFARFIGLRRLADESGCWSHVDNLLSREWVKSFLNANPLFMVNGAIKAANVAWDWPINLLDRAA